MNDNTLLEQDIDWDSIARNMWENDEGVTMQIPELENTLRNDRTYTDEKRRGAIGLLVNRLDKMAGDTYRRRTFFKAYFGVESSRDLTDSQIAGLLAWIDHPHAADDVNLTISEYLKTQGQMEMAL